jgi:signal transduction histidine kinase
VSRILDNPDQLAHMEKMASLGALTAGIAHELNNPINFVSSNINPLKRDIADLLEVLTLYATISPEDDKAALAQKLADIDALKAEVDLEYIIDEINQLLNSIAEGAQRTANIVKDLRNFSRIDKNEIKKVDIHEGLESTLTLLFNQYKNRVTVEKSYGNLPEVECFPGQLNQVWMNILANAIQAMPNGGTLSLKTEPDGDRIRVSIKDTGIGMSDEVRTRIFEAFFTTKDVGEGTGLGMSISASIIEKHHGQIDVESAVGKGSTFVITLPVTQPAG